MKYRKLELLFLSIGTLAVLSSILVSIAQGSSVAEILGQALFVPILFAALQYGRQQGFLTAAASAVIYLVAKVQENNGLSVETFAGQFIIGRAFLFGVVGIFGSELAVRTKYILAGLAGQSKIDDITHLYNQSYTQKLIIRLFYEYNRFGRPFSVLFVTVDWPRPVEGREREKEVAKLAGLMRSNVRLIDEIGFLGDHRFCLVLPDTDAAGANLLFERLHDLHTAQAVKTSASPTFSKRILSAPEDEAEIRSILPQEELSRVTA